MEDFKTDAIKQITERGHSIADVSQRLGVSTHSLYAWIKRHAALPGTAVKDDQSAEIRRLKQELARVTEERDMQKSHRVFRQRHKVKYVFIKAHQLQCTIRVMCQTLCLHPSVFCAGAKQPIRKSGGEDDRQTKLLRETWDNSGKIYGYLKLHNDLRDHGETCCLNRVARLTTLVGIKALIGYKGSIMSCRGKPSIAVDNTLARQFEVDTPDKV